MNQIPLPPLDIRSLYQFIENHGLERIRLAHDGLPSSGNIESLLDTVKNFMGKWSSRNKSSKALRISVEVLQNMTKHAQSNGEDDAYVLFYTSGDKLMLVACNVVSTSNRKKIETEFQSFADNSPEELQQLYRSSLGSAQLTSTGGAGIGLIDIAYRSGSIPEYCFYPIPETDDHYFIMKICLNP